MSCGVCHKKTPSVCIPCVSHNVNKFHERVLAYARSNQQKVDDVERHLAHRLPSSVEARTRLENVRRETEYTRALVAAGQNQLDDLRDRVARRRQTLEESKRQLHTHRSETVNALKTSNKARRKVWKGTFERIVLERRRTLRECIALYRLRPLSSRKRLSGSEPCFFEINGLPLPSFFCLRDYPIDHMTQVIVSLAQLIRQLARYLGIQLPHEISTPSSSALQATVLAPSGSETLSAATSDRPSFATGLACLAINVQHLCRSQEVEVESKEGDDLGRLLYSLLASPVVGQHSDNVAYATSQDKDRASRVTRAGVTWDLDRLTTRISEDLTLDPFEFVEHGSGGAGGQQSIMSMGESHM